MWGSEDWGEMIWGGGAVAVPSLHWSMLALLVLCFLAGGWFLNPANRSRRAYLVAAVLLCLPATTIAVTLPHSFTNGTIADADEVNANFAALEAAVDPLDEGVLQIGNSPPTTYPITRERYVVEANVADVGVVVPIDDVRLDALCRDLDGCGITIAMIDWGIPQPPAFRRFHFFRSETSDYWRTEDPSPATGLDGGSGSQEFALFDCILTDGETGAGGNSRSDLGPGFGLLNVLGGGYNDGTTRCRLVIDD